MEPAVSGRRVGSLITAVVVSCALLAGPAAAQASRTRSGGGTATGHASGGSTASGRASGSTSSASGRATYGYHGGGFYGGHHGGYYGHGYGWYGYPYWGWSGYWGTPYYGYPAPRTYLVAGVPESAPGSVETRVKPKKAEVWVDGKYVGQARDFNGSWDRLWIRPGDHEIAFQFDGYMTLKQHLRLPAAGYVRIEAVLEKGEGVDPRSTEAPPARSPAPRVERREEPPPALARGLLRIEVEPADAVVYLDGEFLAQGNELARLHGAIPVVVGRHVIEVVRPGYETASETVEVADDAPARVRIELRSER